MPHDICLQYRCLCLTVTCRFTLLWMPTALLTKKQVQPCWLAWNKFDNVAERGICVVSGSCGKVHGLFSNSIAVTEAVAVLTRTV